MAKQNKKIKDIFKAKKARRKRLASLPIEEKFDILLQLQKITVPILRSRGLEKSVWDSNIRIFQINEVGGIKTTPFISSNVIFNKEGFYYLSDIPKSWPSPSNATLNYSTDDINSTLSEWRGF